MTVSIFGAKRIGNEMVKEYICRFEKDNKNTELVFDIDNNPISKIWGELVEIHYNKGNTTPRNLNNKLALDYNKVLQEIVELANILELPIDFDTNSYTQEDLNRLHERFHFKEEQVKQSGHFHTQQEYYHKLNVKIHQLEARTQKPHSVSWFINDNEGPFIPIEDHHWKWFSAWWSKSFSPHSLYLGYHTIGKSILTAYTDNDFELVKKDGIRQPEHFSTEVIYSTQRRWRKNKTRQIKKWLKEHNCQDKIDWSLPKYKYYQGHAYLGRLRLNKTEKEILDIWTNWNFKCIDIN